MSAEFEFFKKIVSEYEGKLTEEKGRLTFKARNKVASYYQDGTVHTEKVVECRLRIHPMENEESGKWYSLNGEEETHSILGGFGTTFSEKSLRYNLERYNFKPKLGQLSLF